MKSQIKKELTLTLDEFEVKQLRNIIASCPTLWENKEHPKANVKTWI